jgi:hypothetical protein
MLSHSPSELGEQDSGKTLSAARQARRQTPSLAASQSPKVEAAGEVSLHMSVSFAAYPGASALRPKSGRNRAGAEWEIPVAPLIRC